MVDQLELIQNSKVTLTLTKKTIDWLINNTTVSVFDPRTFEGYQRKIDSSHVKKITDFILKGIGNNIFFMPTSITCAKYHDELDTPKVRIVDGQHRIFAFREIMQSNPNEYSVIKEIEIPVTIMSISRSDFDIEIDTFITINKTSKRVDTSLAMILKNKINALKENRFDINSLKYEYLAVEVAKLLNDDSTSLWYDKISYEGLPKDNGKLISLNGFVSSLRTLISAMNTRHIIDINWNGLAASPEFQVKDLAEFINNIWLDIYNVYQELLIKNEKSIIQGVIGFSAFNHYIKDNLLCFNSLEEIRSNFRSRISNIRYYAREWYQGGTISRNSSAAGHKYVSTLIDLWTKQ